MLDTGIIVSKYKYGVTMATQVRQTHDYDYWSFWSQITKGGGDSNLTTLERVGHVALGVLKFLSYFTLVIPLSVWVYTACCKSTPEAEPEEESVEEQITDLYDRYETPLLGPERRTDQSTFQEPRRVQRRQMTPSAPSHLHDDKSRIRYVGNRALIEQHTLTYNWFVRCAENGELNKLHHAHFDWWMFPIPEESSGHGRRYALPAGQRDALLQDQAFMQQFRQGVYLAIKAWGWDIHKRQPCQHPHYGQKWTGYEIRLMKIVKSLEYFGENEILGRVHGFMQNQGIQFSPQLIRHFNPPPQFR